MEVVSPEPLHLLVALVDIARGRREAIGRDRLIPRAHADEDVRRHVLRVRDRRGQGRVLPGGREREWRQRRRSLAWMM